MLEEITKRFSAEYPIRAFWKTFEEETFEKFVEWSKSPYYHVRRLASEGSRPRLPWGKKILLHYTRTEVFLDVLFTDTARYVTRSVANHLNDISKIDPEFVMRKLDAWENS
jgi:3-methyladenine DNA glycosylase AlkC